MFLIVKVNINCVLDSQREGFNYLKNVHTYEHVIP